MGLDDENKVQGKDGHGDGGGDSCSWRCQHFNELVFLISVGVGKSIVHKLEILKVQNMGLSC